MFDPARLWTGLRPSAARAAEIIPAVVVFPFVALTIVLRESLLPSRAIASGERRSSTRPGSVVPPPRPLARLAAPIARASTAFAPKTGLLKLGRVAPAPRAPSAAPVETPADR